MLTDTHTHGHCVSVDCCLFVCVVSVVLCPLSSARWSPAGVRSEQRQVNGLAWACVCVLSCTRKRVCVCVWMSPWTTGKPIRVRKPHRNHSHTRDQRPARLHNDRRPRRPRRRRSRVRFRFEECRASVRVPLACLRWKSFVSSEARARRHSSSRGDQQQCLWNGRRDSIYMICYMARWKVIVRACVRVRVIKRFNFATAKSRKHGHSLVASSGQRPAGASGVTWLLGAVRRWPPAACAQLLIISFIAVDLRACVTVAILPKCTYQFVCNVARCSDGLQWAT